MSSYWTPADEEQQRSIARQARFDLDVEMRQIKAELQHSNAQGYVMLLGSVVIVIVAFAATH